MWKIKDPELKRKMNQFISDEGIDMACRNEMADSFDHIFFEFEDDGVSIDGVSIRIDKSFFEEIPDYDPDSWNPLSEFEPAFSGCYLVTCEAGSTPVVDKAFFDKATNEWKPQNLLVIAFRELPEPYQPEARK